MPTRNTFVIGLGSPHGDDQAGWGFVERLENRGGVRAQTVRDGAELLAALDGQDDVLIVDASASIDTPGCVRFFKWPSPELVQARPLSTHGVGLIEALRLAEALGQLPCRLTIVTIEAESVKAGEPLSAAVVRALEQLTDWYWQEVESEVWTHEHPGFDAVRRD